MTALILSEPPSIEEEAGFLHFESVGIWVNPMFALIVDNDFVEIPSWFTRIQVTSAMLINPSDGNGVIAPSSSLTKPASDPSKDGFDVELAKRQARNKKRDCKRKEVGKSERLKKQVNEGIPVPRDKFRKLEGSSDALVSGTRMTCQPDAAAMVLFDFGIAQSRESV